MFLHKPFLVKKVSKYFRIQFKHLFLFLYKALSLCLCQGKLCLYMGTIIQLFKELHYNLEAINKANTSKTIFSKHYTHILWIISKLPAHRTLLFFLKESIALYAATEQIVKNGSVRTTCRPKYIHIPSPITLTLTYSKIKTIL